MDDLQAFSEEALSFLRANAAPAVSTAFEWGSGDDSVTMLGENDAESERQQFESARAWQAAKFDAGFGWVDGPQQLGGRGLSAAFVSEFERLEREFEVPDAHAFGVGFGMVVPMILEHAEASIAEEYLPKIRRGDLVCCQLFSEPNAGSDLASVATTAQRDGEEWVVSGQKVWTSGAQFSDLGLLLARTDSELPKHRGLTMFLIDMAQAGVEVRPLRQMSGGSHFNEVFLDGARVPDRMRLGPVNEGWRVAMNTLMNERASLQPGGPNAAAWGAVPFERLTTLASYMQVARRPDVRQQLATLYTDNVVADLTARRFVAAAKGAAPGPEMSIIKLASSLNLARTSAFVSSVLQGRLIADVGEWGTFAWSKFVLATPGMRIGGGTDDIQRNILSERVLAMPRDPS